MNAGEDTQNLGRAGESMLSPEERRTLQLVHQALRERGYSPVRQLASYLMSGEPAYITAHGNARTLIVKLDRDAILEEVVRHYFAADPNLSVPCDKI